MRLLSVEYVVALTLAALFGGLARVSAALSRAGDDVIRLEGLYEIVPHAARAARSCFGISRSRSLAAQTSACIGRNGAGKSTLMRPLSAVDLPDSGDIVTDGRSVVACRPHGRNAGGIDGARQRKFVCRIHGVRGAAMCDKVRYVEEFAQPGSYFDLPVATYSSGMRARLAFGTSMAFDFDYYLIDEILAVGDAGFKAKSRKIFKERLRALQSDTGLTQHEPRSADVRCRGPSRRRAGASIRRRRARRCGVPSRRRYRYEAVAPVSSRAQRICVGRHRRPAGACGELPF